MIAGVKSLTIQELTRRLELQTGRFFRTCKYILHTLENRSSSSGRQTALRNTGFILWKLATCLQRTASLRNTGFTFWRLAARLQGNRQHYAIQALHSGDSQRVFRERHHYAIQASHSGEPQHNFRGGAQDYYTGFKL
ncbi:MAG: hypothetical protein IJS28_09980 [Synergistaceae bacterium]|nr:hypothetical protein [Synergistaceae bacterium]